MERGGALSSWTVVGSVSLKFVFLKSFLLYSMYLPRPSVAMYVLYQRDIREGNTNVCGIRITTSTVEKCLWQLGTVLVWVCWWFGWWFFKEVMYLILGSGKVVEHLHNVASFHWLDLEQLVSWGKDGMEMLAHLKIDQTQWLTNIYTQYLHHYIHLILHDTALIRLRCSAILWFELLTWPNLESGQ